MAGGGAKPSFDHLDWDDPKCEKWAEYIYEPADKLSQAFWSQIKAEDWGQCLICEQDFPTNPGSHIWGRKHCKNLRCRLGWHDPKTPADLEFHTQYWKTKTPGKWYRFNHVTGQQMVCDELPEGAQAQSVAFAASAAAPRTADLDARSEVSALGSAHGSVSGSANGSAHAPAPVHSSAPSWSHGSVKIPPSMPAVRSSDYLDPPTPQGGQDPFLVKDPWANGSDPWAGAGAANGAAKAPPPLRQQPPQEFVPKAPPKAAAPPPPPPNVAPTASVATPPIAAPATAAATDPTAYLSAINDKTTWRSYMHPHAKGLEDSLFKTTKLWKFPCVVCDKEMGRGACDHILSQAHWKALWTKLDANIPSPVEARVWSGVGWVQQFTHVLPNGANTTTLFNHVTGDWKVVDDLPAPASPRMAAAAAGPGGAPAPRAAPSAPASPPPPPPSSGGVAPLPVPSPPVRGGLDLNAALATKAEWRIFMDEPGRQLEKFLGAVLPNRYEPCVVCAAPMNGVHMHLTSQNHWKKIWSKLQDGVIPSPQEAGCWDKPWVEAFPAPKGEFLFNHLTGEQGYRTEIAARASTPVASPTVGRPPPPDVSLPTMLPPGPPPSGVALGASAAVGTPPGLALASPGDLPPAKPANGLASSSGGPPCDLDVFIWQRSIIGQAEELHRVLTCHGVSLARQVVCDVCQMPMGDIADHMVSADHFTNLRVRMSFNAPPKDVLSGPWVQKSFVCQDGYAVPVSFNHITGSLVEQFPPPRPLVVQELEEQEC